MKPYRTNKIRQKLAAEAKRLERMLQSDLPEKAVRSVEAAKKHLEKAVKVCERSE